MRILPLPCDLPAVAAIVGTDPDGEIERAVYALAAAGDLVGACRLSYTIENRYRRAVWLRQFRQATIEVAQNRTNAHDSRISGGDARSH